MSKEINYSDGDVEVEILKELQSAKDLSSDAIIALQLQKKYWAFEYHLSNSRSNLIKHIDFSNKKVLEIGAGMGAISRFVAEKCHHLQVVEGTSRRLACLNARLKGLSNYNIYCGNFKDFATSEKFDVILIIGVLEYADVYYNVVDGQNPFVEFLKKAKSFLNEGGSIVLAIENRLGLKYWSGASEDHTGKLFDGLLGYSTAKSVKTFSKAELKNIFHLAGIDDFEIQYPFPDYKLPKTVLTERLEFENPRLFANLASAGLARDYGKERIVLFNDAHVMSNLTNTGLMGELANSLLFISGKINHELKENCYAVSYTSVRSNNVKSNFIKVNEQFEIVKNLMNDSRTSIDYESITWTNPGNCKIIDGCQLISQLRNDATFDSWDLFESRWYSYLDWLNLNFKSADSEELFVGKAWDLIPQNIILDKQSNFHAIDLEWSLKKSFRKSWLVLRFLLSLDENFQEILMNKYKGLNNFYILSCNYLKVKSDLITIDFSEELNIQKQISGDLVFIQLPDQIDHLKYQFNQIRLKYRADLRKYLAHDLMPNLFNYQELYQKNTDLSIKINEMSDELHLIQHSKSYKISLKFQKMYRFFKNLI